MGKSAQIGMHVWLPDAMEGPTPVSALIHAATMVTAGVFLVARCSFMFEYSPFILQIITIIGAVTCLFAALVAIAQTDIKKIIAYSTCSQLGYMFFACGVSAYQAGVFHLVTHGFFKALLFLSAGSVIHACHEQDVFKMGGLRKKMPITYANFWVGSLAIVGIFPFAGFYSKDLVLESAYAAGGVGNFAFILGILAAILTAIYSLKIIILTFHGKTKLTKEAFEHVHESPKIMNLPLLVLVAGALFSGMLGYYILGISNPYGFFSGSIFNLHVSGEEHHVALGVQLLPLIVGLLGMALSVYIYKGTISSSIANKMKFTYCLLKNKFFFDEIYNKLFIRTTKCLSCLANMFDVKIIDRFGPNGFSVIARGCSWCICQIQTGYMFNYAFYIIFAMVLCVTLFVANYLHGAWGI
jgi:NADH-quinone oxidoreductase subunit L